MIKKVAMKTADTSSGTILRVSAVLLMFLLTSHSLVAQTWFNSSWSYRCPVTVSNSGVLALTNLQVNIKLNASNFAFNNSNNNGSDIRITGSDGVTPIDFWIESWAPGSMASIWVKIPSIPPTGTTLFLYYGNTSAASLSSGSGTFDFFDDFESWSVTPHPSVWQNLAPLPTPSADLTISTYNNKLYSFGGYDPNHTTLENTYVYDPNTNLWSAGNPMPTGRWGMVSVEVGGKIYVFGGDLDDNGVGSDANEIYDPSANTWVSNSNGNPLSLPSYEPFSLGVTHPDVIYFPSGRGGYQYWMVYTPYPTEAEENPSILRSNDGITWTAAGITNPVIPAGNPGSWNDQENPDPDFIYVADYNKWFMVWDGGDVATNSRKIALAYSDDGITWNQYDGAVVNGNANPVILSGDDTFGASWERIDSDPLVSKTATSSLFYQGGTFYLFYAEEASGNNRGKIGLATFAWNNVTNDVVGLARNAGNPIIDLPVDAIFKSGGGHINVSKDQGSDTYRIHVVRELLNSSNFELGLLTSSSLYGPWTSQGTVIDRGAIGQWDEDHIYRTCPIVNSSGEIVLFDNKTRVYYGGIGSQGWRIGFADITQTGLVIKYTGGGPQPMPAGLSHQGLMGVNYLGKIHLFYGNFHYEYDPVTDTYARKADVPNPRSWATCAVVGSNIYLIGGWDLTVGVGHGTNTIQVLNPAADTWDLTRTPMPIARYGATRENPVIDGRIYITHGWNFEGYFFTCNYVYDPATNTWELKGSANHPRDGVACGVVNNKLYVVGGRNSDIAFGAPSGGLNFHEVYDPLLDTWVPQTDPSGWTTSGSNYAFSDITAAYPGSYSGSHGLVVRQPMDGSPLDFRSAETVQDFGTVYALDFDWNVTTLGGILESYPFNSPQGIVRLNRNSDYMGNLLFLQDTGSPTLKWVYGHRGTLSSGYEWDNWHKATVICESPTNNWVVFDGIQYSSVDIPSNIEGQPDIHYSPLPTAPWGTGNIMFSVKSTTQFLDNVRVRKWAGFDPMTLVGIEQNGSISHWTGAISSDWDLPGNWSSGVPGPTNDALVFDAVNDPVISSNITCRNLTIEPLASLTVSTGLSLTISGSLTINSTGTTNSGSLVNNGSVIGTVTYNRYMPIGENWHYVSSPVENSTLSPSGLLFYPWNEVAGIWENSTTSLSKGIGYTLETNSNLVSFSGTLVNSNFGIPVTSPYSDIIDRNLTSYSSRPFIGATGNSGVARSSSNYGGGGWNLLGNPFASAMEVAGFIAANSTQFDPNYVALYLYNGNSYNYVSNSTGWPNGPALDQDFIQVGQGFFVLAMNDYATMNFTKNMQGNSSGAVLLKSTGASERWPGLQLKIKSGKDENLTTIVFNEDMTEALDPGYDIGLMRSGPGAGIYTALVEDNGINFARQALPIIGSAKNIIPVGIDFEKGGQVTFSAEVESLRNFKFWLEDRLTGILTDLGTDIYTITLPAKTYGTGRFFVHVAAGRNIRPQTNKVNLLDIRIWSSQNRQINIQGTVSEKAVCEVFDIWGHKIFETRLTDVNLNTFMLPSVKNGVYLVKVTDGINVLTQKLPLF